MLEGCFGEVVQLLSSFGVQFDPCGNSVVVPFFKQGDPPTPGNFRRCHSGHVVLNCWNIWSVPLLAQRWSACETLESEVFCGT